MTYPCNNQPDGNPAEHSPDDGWELRDETSEFPPQGVPVPPPPPPPPPPTGTSELPLYPPPPGAPTAQSVPGVPVSAGLLPPEPEPRKSYKGLIVTVVALFLVLGAMAVFFVYTLLGSDDTDSSGLHIDTDDMPEVMAEPTIGSGGTFSSGALADIQQQAVEAGADPGDPAFPWRVPTREHSTRRICPVVPRTRTIRST